MITNKYKNPLILSDYYLKNCKIVSNRYGSLNYLNIEEKSKCAEIGVFKGKFSIKIKDILKPKELHLIDINKNNLDKDNLKIDNKKIFFHHADL